MPKRAGNINAEQKKLMIAFLKRNPKMMEGKFDREYTHQHSQELWHKLTVILNRISNGGRKNWQQWRKVWHDMRTKAKSMNKKQKQLSIIKVEENSISAEELIDTSLREMERETTIVSEALDEPTTQYNTKNKEDTQTELLLMKQNYYNQKIKLLERDVIAKEKIANALIEMVDLFNGN